jgi:hypothetical protein
VIGFEDYGDATTLRRNQAVLEFATHHAAFIQLRRLRPLGRLFFEAILRLRSLRPDDLLTILKMALSIDLRDSVSLLPSIQATRF